MELAEQLLGILLNNPGRYSIKELAAMTGATEKQVRYALKTKITQWGYKESYVKRKVLLSRTSQGQGDFELNLEQDWRQFAIILQLASYGDKWVDIRQIAEGREYSPQTILRDIDDLEARGYLEKADQRVRLKKHLIAAGQLTDNEKNRLFHLLLEQGYKLGKPELVQPLLAKLCLGLLASREIESWNGLAQRLYYLGDYSNIDWNLQRKLNRLRVAIAEKRILIFKQTRYLPLQLSPDYEQDSWYLYVYHFRDKQCQKLRVDKLESFQVLPEQYQGEIPAANLPPEPGPIRFLVYPDFSVQQKIIYQLVGLEYVQVRWLPERVMEVTLARPHREDLVNWLRRFGPSIRVLEPEGIKKQLLQSARKIVALYEGRGKK